MIHIFVLKTLNSFIHNLTDMLEEDYNIVEISKVEEIRDSFQDIKQGDTLIIEWANELAQIITNHIQNADEIKIIIRVHSYEAFDGYVELVNWDVVDKVIFVSKFVRDFVCKKFPDLKRKSFFIPNRINVNEFTFKSSFDIKKIAYVGHINFKKGGMLLPHAMKALRDDFEFHILGDFQDIRLKLYFDAFMEKNPDINFKLYDWIPQEEVNNWLEDKDMILCTSLLESQNLSVMQAMLKGIKPLIHHFVA
jgi:glycosyltransferase involved in cell wall biosynthesis